MATYWCQALSEDFKWTASCHVGIQYFQFAPVEEIWKYGHRAVSVVWPVWQTQGWLYDQKKMYSMDFTVVDFYYQISFESWIPLWIRLILGLEFVPLPLPSSPSVPFLSHLHFPVQIYSKRIKKERADYLKIYRKWLRFQDFLHYVSMAWTKRTCLL